MNENVLGRRRFMRSTAAGVIGLATGVAATGTATAATTSADVTVLSASNSWDYYVGMDNPFGRKPPVEKRAEADSEDQVVAGATVNGQVDEYGEDTYWFSDEITMVQASPDGWSSYLDVAVGSTDVGIYTALTAHGNDFDYWFSYDGTRAFVNKGPTADSGDTVGSTRGGGEYANGSVNAGENGDSYRVHGYMTGMIISDPYSSGPTGWEVRFRPD